MKILNLKKSILCGCLVIIMIANMSVKARNLRETETFSNFIEKANDLSSNSNHNEEQNTENDIVQSTNTKIQSDVTAKLNPVAAKTNTKVNNNPTTNPAKSSLSPVSKKSQGKY